MHRALAVLVIAKRFHWQRDQRRIFFGEHRRDLALSGAVNARVGPALFPVIEIRLRFFQALEPLSFQRRFLRVADAGFDFALGEKRALQIVRVTRQKFSQLHNPSIP